MFDFLKTFGQGLLYLILSPLLIAFAIIYMVYAFFVFIFIFFKRIFMFFAGEDMKEELKIDRLAKMHLANQDEEKKEEESNLTPNIQTTNTIVQPIIIQTDENGILKSVQIPNQGSLNKPQKIENHDYVDNVQNENTEEEE